MEVIYSGNSQKDAWHITPPGAGTDVLLEHADAEDLALLQMRAPRLDTFFSARDQSGHPLYSVMFVSDGRLSILKKHTSVELAAGDIAIWQSDIGCKFISARGVKILMILVPGNVMRKNWPTLGSEVSSPRIKTQSALPAIAHGFLESLWQQRNYLRPVELRSATHATMNMLEQAQTMIGLNQSSSTDRFSLIIRFVEESLEDASLSPSMIANRFGCSIRTIHALFAKHGKTVAGEIRDRRLERCRMALTQSREDLVISDLAVRCGFFDAAHFSKLFKAKYGVSPRAYRNRRSQHLQ